MCYNSKIMKGFITALEFLTRVRFSDSSQWNETDFGRSVLFFPTVGFLVGAVMAGVNHYLLLFSTPVFLRCSLLLVVELFCLGGLMYDGFMDTCDGVFSARDREKMLEIMKDSHVGANAVLGLAVLLIFKMALYVSLDGRFLTFALLLAFTVTRSLMVVYIVGYPYPRANGIGKMFKEYSKKWYMVVALLFSCVLSLYLGWLYCYAFLITLVLANIIAKFLQNKLGGLTGDTYGFLTETGFVIYLLGVCFLNKFLS